MINIDKNLKMPLHLRVFLDTLNKSYPVSLGRTTSDLDNLSLRGTFSSWFIRDKIVFNFYAKIKKNFWGTKYISDFQLTLLNNEKPITLNQDSKPIDFIIAKSELISQGNKIIDIAIEKRNEKSEKKRQKRFAFRRRLLDISILSQLKIQDEKEVDFSVS